MTETLEQTLAAYNTWLERQSLAAKTRIAYRLQVHRTISASLQRIIPVHEYLKAKSSKK